MTLTLWTEQLSEALLSKPLVLPKLKDLVLVQTKEWYDLGLQLGVEDTDLDVIQSNNPQNLRACRREMFKAWLKMTPTPTYQQLVDALMAVGEVREADTLHKKFGKCTAAALHLFVAPKLG